MTSRPGFLRSGGWVVIAALLVTTFAFAYYAATLIRGRGLRAVGDGRNAESYGFSLEPCLVPRDRVVASGMPRDGLTALVDPAAWSVAQTDAAAGPPAADRIDLGIEARPVLP